LSSYTVGYCGSYVHYVVITVTVSVGDFTLTYKQLSESIAWGTTDYKVEGYYDIMVQLFDPLPPPHGGNLLTVVDKRWLVLLVMVVGGGE
jgi:hypothetical protein